MPRKAICLLLFVLFFSPIKPFSDGFQDNFNNKSDSNARPEFGFLEVEEPAFSSQGRALAGTPQSIRIHPDYSYLTDITTSYRNYLQDELVPAVISYFNSALKVKSPVTGKITVASYITSLCGLATPSILKTTGVVTDLFIFFQSAYDASSSWVAESSPCFLSSATFRPLIGKSKLNRYFLQEANGDPLKHESNTYLLMHEITHILGFSSTLFEYFIDDNGKKRTGHIKHATLDGKTSLVLDVPPLTQKLRNFFGCSSLLGAYMEDSGGVATAGSHFERRHFVFEAMSSGVIPQFRYSEFTLALLEGSGWYLPNYAYADPYWFGQGEGCGFLTDSCSSANSKFQEFCSGTARGCAVPGRGGGTCGKDVRSNGCQYIYPSYNYDCENPAAADFARLPNLQSFGRTAESKCFTGSLSTTENVPSTSFCFKYACSGSGLSTRLQVTVGGQSLICSKKGKMSVVGYKGTIDCPDPLEFCQTVGRKACSRNCMGRGFCSNGECTCYKGYKGIDCGMNI